MKKIICIILGVILISGIAIVYIFTSDKGEEPQYMPCPVLGDGETMDVEIPKSMYYGSSASAMARYYKEEERCIDAWVNDYGVLVVRLDQDTLEKNYELHHDELMKILNSKLSKVRKEISYDYSVLTLYVNDETTLDDFLTVMMVTPGNCIMLKLLQGIPSYEIAVDVVVIYEPTGKEILRLDEKTQMNLNRDDWDRLLESGRQGN